MIRGYVSAEACPDVALLMCDHCKTEFNDSWPHHHGAGNYHLCADCSYIVGVWSEGQYLKYNCFSFGRLARHADIIDGKIILSDRKDYSPTQDYRHVPEYKKWRADVFNRDKYTCQKCFISGRIIQAHHKHSYKDYPQERFIVENGVTYCFDCHHAEHRSLRKLKNEMV